MRHIYSLLMYLLLPYFYLQLLWKGRKIHAYRERILERFCWDKMEPTTFDVWIHAVSLGEVIAAVPLIDELLKKQRRLLITTMTPTGAERVAARFGDSVTHRYLPYDLPTIARRFFKRTQPRIGVIMETELWPNIITQAERFKIPLLLINARLSERSYLGYKKIRFFFKPILNRLHAILAQGKADAQRFKALGAANHRTEVFGNVKFDLQTDNIASDTFAQLKSRWGSERSIVMIASTHEDEEQQILSCLKTLQNGIPGVILLIAPRHPERFQKIFQLARQNGFETGLRSKIETVTPNTEVIILDSMGELMGFYQLSDYAFLGGSFVPVGGHNVLEPIAVQVPVFTGKNVQNFKAICQDLVNAQAIEFVENAQDLMDKIISLHADITKKQKQVDNATRVLEMNKGAVGRYIEKIESLL